MSRAYVRLDPAMFERKVIQQRYTPLGFAALVATICLAESQPVRGRFRDRRMLETLLGPLSRQAATLISRGDVVAAKTHSCAHCPPGHGAVGQLYVDGWDEWQEGDVQVRERMARLRARKRNAGDGADRNESDGAEGNSGDGPNRIPTVASGTSGRQASNLEDLPSPVSVPRDAVLLTDDPKRPDLVALRKRGVTYIRQRELEILDHIADNERKTERDVLSGYQVVASWIAEAPKGSHLVDFVMQRENDLKRERGASADEIEAAWEETKAADKRTAPEQIGAIMSRVVEVPGG